MSQTDCACVLACLAIVACQGRSDPPSPSPSPSTDPAAPAAAKAGARPVPHAPSPHGGTISVLAVADTGDAAASVDDLDDARVWPRLDGSAEPVPIRVGHSVVQIALARTREGLVVAARDSAGGVAVVALTSDGAELGRVQLPDAHYDQVELEGEHVLARRSDQRIARFDARGVAQGDVAAAPGEQIATLAVRRGLAIAITGDSDHGFHTLRELDLTGDTVRWGRARELPHPVSGHVALSPNHQRLAAQNALNSGVEVIELARLPLSVFVGVGPNPEAATQLGFVDDDHLAIARGSLEWWIAPPATGSATGSAADAWARVPPQTLNVSANVDIGFGDGVLAVPAGSALALVDHDRTRWLGYRVLAEPKIASDGAGQFVVGPMTGQLVWLDAALHQTRAFTVPLRPGETLQSAFALDSHHVLVENRVDQPRLEVYDADRPGAPTPISIPTNRLRFEHDADRHMIVVETNDRLVERLAFDPVTARATRLPQLHADGELKRVFITDPARAGGVSTVVFSERDDGPRVESYTDAGSGSGSAGRDAAPVPGLRGDIAPLFVLADGTRYELAGARLAVRRGARVEHVTLPADAPSTALRAISHDGASLVAFLDHKATMLDATGQPRWRKSIWQLEGAVFSADDRVVAVATTEGLVAFDVATGEQLGTACGWQFGLSAEPLAEGVLGMVPLCAQ